MGVPKALTIAGSDSGGGAGIQADLKTFSAFRVFGMSVLTAVTAQNSVGVTGVHNLPPEFVALQLDAVLSDFGADADEDRDAVDRADHRRRGRPAGARASGRRSSLDPVMIAKSGDAAAAARRPQGAHRADAAAGRWWSRPTCTEAAALADMPVATEADMEEAARRIHARGPRHVLVKGGHLKDSATDILYDGRAFTRFSGTRVDSQQHARHRLHAVGRDRGRPRPRPPTRGGDQGGQGLRDRRHPRRLRRRPRRGGAATLRDRLVAMARTVDDKMPFLEHLGELRVRIMRSLIALLIGLVIAFPASQYIMDFLARPIRATGNTLVFRRWPRRSGCKMKVGHLHRAVPRLAGHPVAGVAASSRPACTRTRRSTPCRSWSSARCCSSGAERSRCSWSRPAR